MRSNLTSIALIGWQLVAFGTTIYLMIEDWPDINWWNWIIFIPVNLFLGEIWPIYWLILRPIFGG